MYIWGSRCLFTTNCSHKYIYYSMKSSQEVAARLKIIVTAFSVSLQPSKGHIFPLSTLFCGQYFWCFDCLRALYTWSLRRATPQCGGHREAVWDRAMSTEARMMAALWDQVIIWLELLPTLSLMPKAPLGAVQSPPFCIFWPSATSRFSLPAQACTMGSSSQAPASSGAHTWKMICRDKAHLPTYPPRYLTLV